VRHKIEQRHRQRSLQCRIWVIFGCFLNEINESAYALAAEEIAADARTAVPGQEPK